MYLKRLLLSIFLLSSINGAAIDPTYLLTIPAVLVANDTGNVCFNIISSNQSLHATIQLQYDFENITILDEEAIVTNFFQCNTFNVPSVDTNTPVFVYMGISGKDWKIEKRKSVVIQPYGDNTYAQFDKPLYQPGDLVKFHVFCLNHKLLPQNKTYAVIYITDPSGNRLAQWLDQTLEHGILEFQFQLEDDAAPGYYTIYSETETSEYSNYIQSFPVQEYVTPRFEVNVIVPNAISVLDINFLVEVLVLYTYGDPVPGVVTARICRSPAYHYGPKSNCFYNIDICHDITGTIGPNGTFSSVVDLHQFYINLQGFQMGLSIELTVVEAGTGVQVKEYRYMYISSQLANVRFLYESMDTYYRHGLPYPVGVALTNEKNEPIPNQQIKLSFNDKFLVTITTDSSGKAGYLIDTNNYIEPNFNLTATYENPDQCYYLSYSNEQYPTDRHQVLRFYSETGSFVQIHQLLGELSCGQSYSVDVQYILTREGVGEASTITFYTMIMSKLLLVQHASHDVDLTTSLTGTFSVEISVSDQLAPTATLLVYCILDIEIIAHTITLNIEKCFRNKVSLNFSQEVLPPGSNVDLQLSAAPWSICGVRVVDYGLTLLNQYEGLSANNVYSPLYALRLYGYRVGGYELEDPAPPCEDPNKQVFCRGRYYVPVSYRNEGDTYTYFKNIGLIVETPNRVQRPVVCGEPDPYDFIPLYTAFDASAKFSGSSPNTVETVRKNFAGAFGFLIVPTDSEGHATQTQLVPDSITLWEGSSFCLSDVEGFGFTEYPANLTTFLPLFGEITIPFSILRGEIMVLRAAVSNYFENRCIKVHVELQQSNDYEATPVGDNQEDRSLQSGQKSFYFWNIDAKSLGKVEFTFSAETTFIGESCDGESDPTIEPHRDTVIQNLLIKPEGIPQESTTTYLVCVEDSTSNLQFSISVPENAVVDSIKASVTFVGDFLSLTWTNIENLLRMPSGCCEQKLARMAPIPYLLNYMNTTHQLTDELLQKGTEYLIQGRNQMFRCRSYDGSYGVFWSSVSNGNSWLTASAYKTFAKSSGYITIDKTQQEQTMIWLSKTQDLESGCFIPQGNLFTVEAVENPSVLFTAHMSITLSETNDSLIGIVMQEGALRCLRSAINENSNGLYTQSLILRAMTLAQDWENRDILLEQIKGKAISEDGTLHWELDDISIVRSFYYCRYYPSELEIAANILLSILDGPVFTDDDLIYSTKIALWLSRQFNSRGGFCSSQDTVVVLQALSLFATKIFQPNSHHDITVNDGSEDIIAVTLNQDNRLLVQTHPLPHIPGNYNTQVTGLGCCLIQATTEYNIVVPETGSAFDVSAVTTSPQCTNGAADIIAVNITMSYNGPYNDSGMVVIDFRCFSGYTDDYTSLYELESDRTISKVERSDGHIYIYIISVSSKKVNISFKMLMGQRVLKVQNGSIYVFSYYRPDQNGYAQYSHPCSDTV